MGLRSGVGIEPCLISLKGGPIDEAGMMILDENGPLLHGKMSNPFSDRAVLIDVAFVAGFAVRVSASIHRIGEDVVECGVSRSDPADRTRHTRRRRLKWKGQTLGAEPKPDAACRAEFGETLKDRADGATEFQQAIPIGVVPGEA